MNKLKIKLDNSGFGLVELNGTPVETTGIEIKSVPGEPAEVRISVLAKVEGELEIHDMATVSKKPLKAND